MPNMARIITWDGLFGGENLPQIALSQTPVLPGASLDWAVDTLLPGDVASWDDMVGGKAFVADGKTPTVAGSGAEKHISFDGETSRMKAVTPVSGPHTIITVYRFKNPDAHSVVHYGTSGSGAGWVGTGGSGATVNAGGTGRFLVPNPYIAPDTNWHVAILTVDGATSAFRHDRSEVGGTIGDGVRDGITLGFATGGTGRTAIDYKRIAVIPGKMDSGRRAGISEYLMRHYGIGVGA